MAEISKKSVLIGKCLRLGHTRTLKVGPFSLGCIANLCILDFPSHCVMGYPISAGITRNTDACKHCYLPNNELAHWHKSYLPCRGSYSLLLPLVKSIALPLKSNYSILHNTWKVELKLRALYSQPNALLPRYYSKKSEESDSPITSTFTFKI